MKDSLINEAIKALRERGFFQSTQIVPKDLVLELQNFAKVQFEQQNFRQAKIGRGQNKQENTRIRGDKIFWIENWETRPFLDLGKLIQGWMEEFRQNLFLPLKSFEGHLAFYEPGAFYIKHTDQHKDQVHRQISLVLYLNTIPIEVGGTLKIFEDDKVLAEIQPEEGKLVLFDSRLLHEVLPTQTPRWSLTAWLGTSFPSGPRRIKDPLGP